MSRLTNKQKEDIEKHLLDAMSSIDKAVWIMWEHGDMGDPSEVLRDCNKKLKSVLNEKYDRLARQRE